LVLIRHLCPVNAHFIKNVHADVFRLTSNAANVTIAIITIIARIMAGVKSGVLGTGVGEADDKVGVAEEVGVGAGLGEGAVNGVRVEPAAIV
jgi:hypothetical protein